MVGQVVRSFKEYKFLKEAYDSGRYGKLKSMVMQRISGDVRWGFENWFQDERKSGSVVLDCMCMIWFHPLYAGRAEEHGCESNGVPQRNGQSDRCFL